MDCVLDTCTFFWLADDQSKLSAPSLKLIENRSSVLHVPVIVLVELHRLIRRGRIVIRAPDGLDKWFRSALAQYQAFCEPITLEIAHAAEVLPPIHNDPADRFILATAQILHATILSPDTMMRSYSGANVVW